MRDIMRLLFGDDPGPRPDGDWDDRGRRARVTDSRQWCGTQPGDDAIAGLAAALGASRGRMRPPRRAHRPGRPG